MNDRVKTGIQTSVLSLTPWYHSCDVNINLALNLKLLEGRDYKVFALCGAKYTVYLLNHPLLKRSEDSLQKGAICNWTWKVRCKTSLVVQWLQWLRIHLPMQGTWVRALVQEDPTCHRATKPMHHNYWAWALEPASHNSWARAPQLLKPARLEKSPQWEACTTKSRPRSPQLEKARAQQQRPNAAKN